MGTLIDNFYNDNNACRNVDTKEVSKENSLKKIRLNLLVGDDIVCELDKSIVDKVFGKIIQNRLELQGLILKNSINASKMPFKIENGKLIYNCKIEILPEAISNEIKIQANLD